MRYGEHGYLDLLSEALNKGEYREDRTGVGCFSLHAPQLRFSMNAGFPLLTTKRVSFHNVMHELLWFLSGSTNVKPLQERNVHIWDEWADDDGELGPVYGHQWRNFQSVDQINQLVNGLITNPNSRRHIVTAWNPGEVDQMALPPCHLLFQVFFHPKTRQLSLHMYQRSADLFLGVPYNIASYALLLELIAAATGHRARELVISFGDAHVYTNHAKQVREQLTREVYTPPLFKLRPGTVIEPTLLNIDPDALLLEEYKYHPAISAPVAV